MYYIPWFWCFGLPAEQYAIQTGVHPLTSTMDNIRRYKQQLENIEWITTGTARLLRVIRIITAGHNGSFCNYLITTMIRSTKRQDRWMNWFLFLKRRKHRLQRIYFGRTSIYSRDWNGFSDTRKDQFLMNYRLGFIERKPCQSGTKHWELFLPMMKSKTVCQNAAAIPLKRNPWCEWALRITAYADRLFQSLEHLEWSDSMKLMQSNWIGKSSGAEINFEIKDHLAALKILLQDRIQSLV